MSLIESNFAAFGSGLVPGNLGEGQPAHVVQEKDRALLRREVLERSDHGEPDVVAEDHGRFRTGGWRAGLASTRRTAALTTACP